MYPLIKALFEKQGCPSWTEFEIRKLNWEHVQGAKVIPDVAATKNRSTLIAVEAKQDTLPASFKEAVGQTRRFSAFADMSYIAFWAPIPEIIQTELRLICKGTGLLEVYAVTGVVKELISAREQRPKIAENKRQWLAALKEVKKRQRESAANQLRVEKLREIKALLHGRRAYPGYRPLIKDIRLDESTRKVEVITWDPPEFATSLLSPEYVDDGYFRACCVEMDSQICPIFDIFGSETAIEFSSEVFQMRDCGHTGSHESCPQCSSLIEPIEATEDDDEQQTMPTEGE